MNTPATSLLSYSIVRQTKGPSHCVQLTVLDWSESMNSKLLPPLLLLTPVDKHDEEENDNDPPSSSFFLLTSSRLLSSSLRFLHLFLIRLSFRLLPPHSPPFLLLSLSTLL